MKIIPSKSDDPARKTEREGFSKNFFTGTAAGGKPMSTAIMSGGAARWGTPKDGYTVAPTRKPALGNSA
jgi:hypothetical protein